jgi:phosphatidylglycerophosphatase A
MNRLRWLLATCGGVGYSPILPGTCGALWGLPIYWAILLGTPPGWHTALLALALLLSCVVTFWLSPWSLVYFGEEDSSRFVTDEIAGFLFTVLLFRPEGTTLWVQSIAAFLVTRTIDICKVPPARKLENLPGGWGVLADDLLGSIYAAALLWFIWWQFPQWFTVSAAASA